MADFQYHIAVNPKQKELILEALEALIERRFQWLSDYGDSTTNTIQEGDRESTIKVKKDILQLEKVVDQLALAALQRR